MTETPRFPRLRRFFRLPSSVRSVERDVDEELRFHFDLAESRAELAMVDRPRGSGTLTSRGIVSLKSFVTVATLIVTLGGPASGQRAPQRDDHLRSVALRVTDLEMRRQLSSATAATIDSLLALYADSVVYEHPNAGAVVRGKAVMRRNMIQYIGSVRALNADAARVTVGHGVAIVESSARMEIHDGDKWVPVSRHGIRVIEFDDRGFVRRIIDYPW